MAYAEASFSSLGAGLNLRDRPDTVSEAQALDAMNVTFTEAGAVRQRDGYNNLTSALTNAAATIIPFYRTSTADTQLVAGCGTRLEGLSSAGAVVASATGLTTGTWGFARFGTPGNEVVYAGQGSTNLNKWDGSSWTTAIASTPDAGSLCVMPVSNRLVAARFNTTTGGPTGGASTSSPSHVYFSDAGAPETWTSTNFIQLTPGDGEKVQSVVAWGDQVFVFKESKYAVVYGESTDSGGDPVFDYRVEDTGAGALGPKAVCVGTDGVYFASRNGVYRTTGGPPERLSDLIRPIFDSTAVASDYYLGGTMLQSQAANTALWWHNDQLYAAFTTTGTANNRTLIYDPTYQWWSLTDLPAACGTSFRRSSSPELVFADTTNKIVYYSNTSLTNDDGTAITSRWRSGWTDFGSPSRKRVREQKFWGGGKVFAAIGTDFEAAVTGYALQDFTLDTATWGTSTWGSTTWGDDQSIRATLRRVSAAGTTFSLALQNTTLDQTWSLHRVTAHIAGPRIPSVIDS